MPKKADELSDRCTSCPHHEVVPDPDPDDWFCDDDVRVVCLLAKKTVVSGCRPYRIKKESERPGWCPLARKR